MLTTAQLAGLLNVSVYTVRRYIKGGKIPFIITPGGHYRFRESDIYGLMGSFNSRATQDSRDVIRSRAKALLTIHNMNVSSAVGRQTDTTVKYPEYRKTG